MNFVRLKGNVFVNCAMVHRQNEKLRFDINNINRNLFRSCRASDMSLNETRKRKRKFSFWLSSQKEKRTLSNLIPDTWTRSHKSTSESTSTYVQPSLRRVKATTSSSTKTTTTAAATAKTPENGLAI